MQLESREAEVDVPARALLPGLPVGLIRACYAAAPGNEIASGKCPSRESSAALAANTFGPFMMRPGAQIAMAPANVSLPNGTVVSCLQRHEVPIVYREVQSYFSNGLRLSPGDTVFDVGANIGLFSLDHRAV